MFCFLSLTYNAKAQFQNITGSTNNSWRTIGTFAGPGTPVGAIGIGNFPNATNLPSALTINTTLLPVPSGEVFRTSGPFGQTHSWRLETGPQERFRLFVPAGTSKVFLQASGDGGSIGLKTPGPIATDGHFTRFRIFDGGSGPFHGRIIIGNNLLDSDAPQDRVHLYQDIASDVRLRFSYNGLASGSSIGIDNQGRYHLTQFEVQPMIFHTSNMERMRINELGVGYYNFAPNSPASNATINTARFNIFDDTRPQLRLLYAVDGNDVADKVASFQTTNLGDLFIEPKDESATNKQRFVGIHTDAPLNTLEINSTAASPYFGDPNGSSGLRFTNMNNSNIPIDNPDVENGVLSVDNQGNVILVTGGGGGSVSANNGLSLATSGDVVLGHSINGSGSGLLDSREIPMNGHDIHFTDGSSSAGRFSIGGITSAGAKLHVKADNTSSNGVLIENQSAGGTGLLINASGSGTSGQRINVANGSGADYTVSGANGINIYTAGGSISRGVFSQTTGGGYIVGVHGEASGGSTSSIGIYGTAPVAANSWAGYFQGDVNVNGNYYQSGVLFTSDQSFKTNISTIANSLSLVENLEPKSFYFDTTNSYGFNFSSHKQYGFLAQEIEEFLPELVFNNTKPAEYDSLGNEISPAIEYKSLNYNAFIAILTDAVQEQQKQITDQKAQLENQQLQIADLQAQIDAKEDLINQQQNQITDLNSQVSDLNSRLTHLENCLSALLPTLCSMNQEAIQQTNQEEQAKMMQSAKAALEVRLSDKYTIVLAQNVPNPFAEMTTIKYNIPSTVKEAQIHFYTSRGVIINSVDITERGNGEIRVFAEDLSSGLYTYSLVADGKIVATKKMVKQ